MIYFVINNNYQYYDFEAHLASLSKEEVVLIEIPHTLDQRQHAGYAASYRYCPIFGQGLVKGLRSAWQLSGRIAREIKPGANDVCFIYSEYEILNQCVASAFRAAGARIYLIEDGGLGTYIPFRVLESEPLTFKQKLQSLVYRKIYRMPELRVQKISGVQFYWMPDNWMTGSCLYYPVALRRSIPRILLQRPSMAKIRVDPNTAVFLNEPIYQHYQGTDKYLAGLKLILGGICGRFEKVLFKYHPRESAEWRESIRREVLSQFPNLSLIDEQIGIELLIDRYRPAVAASYFCSALFNIAHRGVEPIYLYHLIPDMACQKIFMETTEILKELNYDFIASFDDIDANYRSGISAGSDGEPPLSIAALVRND